jgi:hypothetical protein
MTKEEIERRELSARGFCDPYKKHSKNKHKINRRRGKKYVSSAIKNAKNSKMRGDDRLITFLALYRPLLRYFADHHNIKPVEAEFLIWAHAYEYFIIDDAMSLFFIGQNLRKIVSKLTREGLLVKMYGGHRAEGIPAKFCVSQGVSWFVSKYIYGVMLGQEELPEHY